MEVFHDRRFPSLKEPEETSPLALTLGMEMMIAGLTPNILYFNTDQPFAEPVPNLSV
jgi:hypothetical protein